MSGRWPKHSYAPARRAKRTCSLRQGAYVDDFRAEPAAWLRDAVGDDGAQPLVASASGSRSRARCYASTDLILDEPTLRSTRARGSHLRGVAQLDGWPTTFVIAHRLSNVRHADKILVIDGGRVVGSEPRRQPARTSAVSRALLNVSLCEPPDRSEPPSSILLTVTDPRRTYGSAPAPCAG